MAGLAQPFEDKMNRSLNIHPKAKSSDKGIFNDSEVTRARHRSCKGNVYGCC